eukprot:Gb_33482 [translate_table: standard]
MLVKMARGSVADLQPAPKKKTAASRSWAVLDSNGESTVLDVDKYAIMHRVRIHARDLRILDPLLSYPSTILGRERAIVLNLEVLLRNPGDEYVIPILEELCRRLPGGSTGQRADHSGDGRDQSNGQQEADAGDEDESPFEFRALEVALEAICSFLDARTTELETAAYPALDELTSKRKTLPERYANASMVVPLCLVSHMYLPGARSRMGMFMSSGRYHFSAPKPASSAIALFCVSEQLCPLLRSRVHKYLNWSTT